jgi:hypothetical protein
MVFETRTPEQKESRTKHKSLFKRRKEDAPLATLLSIPHAGLPDKRPQSSIPSQSTTYSNQSHAASAATTLNKGTDRIPEWIDNVIQAHEFEHMELPGVIPVYRSGNNGSARERRHPALSHYLAEDNGDLDGRADPQITILRPESSQDDNTTPRPSGQTQYTLTPSHIHRYRPSTNTISTSRSSSASPWTRTSIYSEHSSVTSPGAATSPRLSDEMRAPTTLKNTRNSSISTRLPTSQPHTHIRHLTNTSTTYTIMDPTLAGVFDDAPPTHVYKPSVSLSIFSPVKAGVFDDEKADLNKPLPPDPSLRLQEQRRTFFVVGEAVRTLQLPTLQCPDDISNLRSARLSRPFIEPIILDADISDDDSSDEECRDDQRPDTVSEHGPAELPGDMTTYPLFTCRPPSRSSSFVYDADNIPSITLQEAENDLLASLNIVPTTTSLFRDPRVPDSPTLSDLQDGSRYSPVISPNVIGWGG